MLRFVLVGVGSGVLFGVLDAAINGNPLARRLMVDFEPIAKTTINVPAGVLIDLGYGFALAGLFLLLFDGLPGDSGLLKGLGFGGIAWFLRVVMSVATQWMTLNVSPRALAYTLLAGLGEMLVLGAVYGLTLEP